MATASSSEVRNASTTCISDDLATMQTAAVWASTSWRSVSSSSALTPARRVEPKATSVADVRCSSSGPGRRTLVLGIGPGPAALDEGHPEVVELLGDPQLVVDGERQPLLLGAVPQRGVEDVDRRGQHREVEVVPAPGLGRRGCGPACTAAWACWPGVGVAGAGWAVPASWLVTVAGLPDPAGRRSSVGPSLDMVQPVLVLVDLAAHGGEVGLLELRVIGPGFPDPDRRGRRRPGSAPPRRPSR